MTKVGVIKCKGYPESEKAVGKLFDLSTNLNKLLAGKKKILIKPNILGPSPPETAVATHPRIIEALIKKIREYGAFDIKVGEHRSQAPGPPLKKFEVTGILEVCKNLKVEAVAFDKEKHLEVKVPNGKKLHKVRLPKSVLESDVFINVPKMKSLGNLVVTLGIKNLMGIINMDTRAFLHSGGMAQGLIDLMKVVKSHYTLIDGILGMEGNGPLFGDPIQSNVLVGGEDIVAVDAVGTAVMGFDPFEIATTRLGQWEGMGIGNVDQIEVVGTPIGEAKVLYKRPLEDILAVYGNVECLIGTACKMCIETTRNAIDGVLRRGLLEGKKITLIMGRHAPLPERIETDEVFVIGDCAQEHRAKGVFIAGCCPFPGETSRRLRESLEG